MKKILFLTSFFLFIFCSPRVRTFLEKQSQPLAADQKVYVIPLNEELKLNAQNLGRIEIGETGFTSNCSYEDVISVAKTKAREFGANIIKVTEHEFPNGMRSSCHKIKIDLLFTENTIKLNENQLQMLQNKEDWDYALLHLYRTDGYGKDLDLDLLLDGKKLHTITNNSKTTIKIPKTGIHKIHSTLRKYQTGLSINFEKGMEYFIECKVTLEPMVGAPYLELKNHQIGKQIFDNFNSENSF